MTYLIQTRDELIYKRYIDHLKSLGPTTPVQEALGTPEEEVIYPCWLNNNTSTAPSAVSNETDPNPVPEQSFTRRYLEHKS